MTQYNYMGGAYSQRRYSNAATIPESLKTQSGNATSYRIVTNANDRSMGDVEIKVNSVGGDLGAQKEKTERYSRFTPVGGTLYRKGTKLQITAKPNPGYKFVSWSGVTGPSHTAKSILVTVDRNMEFTAMFEPLPGGYDRLRTVHVRWDTSMGRVDAEGNTMTNGDITAHAGDYVTIEATPLQGYRFVHWSGAPVNGNVSPKVSFNVNNNYNIRAVFAKDGNGKKDPSPTPDGPTPSPDPDYPSGPGGGGGGGGNGGGSELPVQSQESIKDKAVAFVKQWWWALAIAAYVIYKETKGAKP